MSTLKIERVGIAIIHGSGTAEQVISDVTGSPDNHVAFRYTAVHVLASPPPKGLEYVTIDHKLECIWGHGVVDDSWAILESQTDRKVLTLYEPKFDLRPAITYALTLVGQHYSMWSVVGAFFDMLLHWKHNPLAGMNCSSFMMKCLQKGGYPGSGEYDWGSTRPDQIQLLMDKNKEPKWT